MRSYSGMTELHCVFGAGLMSTQSVTCCRCRSCCDPSSQQELVHRAAECRYLTGPIALLKEAVPLLLEASTLVDMWRMSKILAVQSLLLLISMLLSTGLTWHEVTCSQSHHVMQLMSCSACLHSMAARPPNTLEQPSSVESSSHSLQSVFVQGVSLH